MEDRHLLLALGGQATDIYKKTRIPTWSDPPCRLSRNGDEKQDGVLLTGGAEARHERSDLTRIPL